LRTDPSRIKSGCSSSFQDIEDEGLGEERAEGAERAEEAEEQRRLRSRGG
jgi:hypothetical protein